MLYAAFSDVDSAREHRGQHGGWIFVSAARTRIIWFDRSFTPSSIFTHYTTDRISGELI